MDLTSDALMRVGCVAVATAGLLLLVLATIRFEQHRRGRIAAAVIGAVLVLLPLGVVLWGPLTA